MPWQGHLLVGVPVHNYVEAADAFRQMGAHVEVSRVQALSGDEFKAEFGGLVVKKTIRLAGQSFDLEFSLMVEGEGGVSWPVPSGEAYCDAVVAAELTRRYRGAVLDRDFQRGGRPEPFVIDLAEVDEIMKQVREFWSQAELLIWTIWH